MIQHSHEIRGHTTEDFTATVIHTHEGGKIHHIHTDPIGWPVWGESRGPVELFYEEQA